MLSDGTAVCDRDGRSCGNGGVFDALVVSDFDSETNMVVNLHFCRDREEEGKIVKGCASKVLSARNTADYNARRKASDAS